ncbi:MAG TPA: hypothetical protein DIU39_01090 [Flavobacteriales bacterium]|nr:hypothetical protein [Flavobacteriales bacterium]|tara:strand:- start:16830 stop:17948 length:1119 start_codon:yes stop_codon:yes gene_type:complete
MNLFNIAKAVTYFLLLLFIISCGENEVNHSVPEGNEVKPDTIRPEYAKGFYFLKYQSNDYVLILQDEKQSKTKKYHFTLNDSASKSSDKIPLPVQSAVAFSSTHYGFLEPLNQTEIIKGISGKEYLISNHKEEIEEIGFTENLNFEKIVSLKPQVVFGNNFQSLDANFVNKFAQLGIAYIPISEYSEDSPLARAEWIKVFGLLTGKTASADSIFRNIEKQYLQLKQSACNKNKPTVLMSFPYQNTWYVPGGKSFQATFVKDAGGNYIFSENQDKNSFIADSELILEKGKNADFWLNLNNIQTKKEILDENPLFARFKAFQNNTIFNNNKQMVGKANAYWQTGVVNPHKILADIIHILQNDTNKNLNYYKPVR